MKKKKKRKEEEKQKRERTMESSRRMPQRQPLPSRWNVINSDEEEEGGGEEEEEEEEEVDDDDDSVKEKGSDNDDDAFDDGDKNNGDSHICERRQKRKLQRNRRQQCGGKRKKPSIHEFIDSQASASDGNSNDDESDDLDGTLDSFIDNRSEITQQTADSNSGSPSSPSRKQHGRQSVGGGAEDMSAVYLRSLQSPPFERHAFSRSVLPKRFKGIIDIAEKYARRAHDANGYGSEIIDEEEEEEVRDRSFVTCSSTTPSSVCSATATATAAAAAGGAGITAAAAKTGKENNRNFRLGSRHHIVISSSSSSSSSSVCRSDDRAMKLLSSKNYGCPSDDLQATSKRLFAMGGKKEQQQQLRMGASRRPVESIGGGFDDDDFNDLEEALCNMPESELLSQAPTSSNHASGIIPAQTTLLDDDNDKNNDDDDDNDNDKGRRGGEDGYEDEEELSPLPNFSLRSRRDGLGRKSVTNEISSGPSLKGGGQTVESSRVEVGGKQQQQQQQQLRTERRRQKPKRARPPESSSSSSSSEDEDDDDGDEDDLPCFTLSGSTKRLKEQLHRDDDKANKENSNRSSSSNPNTNISSTWSNTKKTELSGITSKQNSSSSSSSSLRPPPEPPDGAEADVVTVVVVDSKQTNCISVYKELRKKRIETLVTSLRCVDFIAGPRCGVLRFSKSDISKRAADNDNTSWKARVQDAARIFEKVVLVVQNDHKRSEAYIAKMGDSPSYHRNIANLTATPGIAVMYSDDPKHSAELIYSICITEQRHLKERIELSKELKSGDCSLEKEIQFLCSIPGVHYVHALSLLTEFKFCLRDALNAPLKILEERMRKHLMSPMKSRKFYEFVRRDYDKSMLLKNLPS